MHKSHDDDYIIILIVLLQIGLVGHEAPILLNPDQSFWSQTVTHLDHHHHSFWSSIVFIFIFIIKSQKKGSKEGSSSMVTKCQLTRDCFLTFVRENSRKSWTRKKSHFQPPSKRIQISNYSKQKMTFANILILPRCRPIDDSISFS